jgi:hypothetical protein
MRVGIHTSIAAGVERAMARAKDAERSEARRGGLVFIVSKQKADPSLPLCMNMARKSFRFSKCSNQPPRHVHAYNIGSRRLWTLRMTC